ncbi:adenylate/guanylate cyclase domain-containing protein [Herbaspirillum autotrophicum]|uniref:adenylate/guanylate cyclase domain-containing protein n=1 Tax=Herbaspirillum autotrophicum TaxID=180195 RepID=UPI001E4C9709|nr:adenylate/guanylate cyclase domain-containing protein [Herbaspirillum autotrophicum]
MQNKPEIDTNRSDCARIKIVAKIKYFYWELMIICIVHHCKYFNRTNITEIPTLREADMTRNWKHARASENIDKKIADVKTVVIKDYVRDMSLESIPTNTGYKVDGVHMYVDILNLDDMLNVTDSEGERCHSRTLQFLNLHYRAVHRILNQVDVRRVDNHNERIHALVTKPYNSETNAEKKRIQKAVATGQLMVDVLKRTGDDNDAIPSANVRVGIDTGLSIAVNNGRNGYREPLFLGEPANHAAKMSAGNRTGIYLTNEARVALGLKKVEDPKSTPLSGQEITDCQDAANLDVSADNIVNDWKDDLKNSPVGSFSFSRHTPPLAGMDLTILTPANSRRQEAVSIYADIDYFTKYVSDNIDHNPEDVVRVLHVLRAELERVLTADFKGRRIRFIGDCIHGLLCEGTSQTTDTKETISTSVLLAGALRSSFDLAIEMLKKAGHETGKLGLAIGLEYGQVSISRLGIKGSRVRCAVSRGVLRSEEEQCGCTGVQTAIGPSAYADGTQAVKDLFGRIRKVANLDYDEAVDSLSDKDDATAKRIKTEAYVAAPAIIKAEERPIRPYAVG